MFRPKIFRIIRKLPICALACACVAAQNSAPSGTGDAAKDLGPLLQQFADVFSMVEAQAASEPSSDKLIYEGAIPSMLRGLDPHTQFFDPGQFQQLKQMEESEQKGFGSIVSVLPGQVIFLQTLPGTPSNRAGIQAGDELVAINNYSIHSLEVDQIIELLTQARQHKVVATIRRQDKPKTLEFTLTPELVDSPSVDRAFMLRPRFGYVRVASWDMETASQLKSAIQKLGDEKLSGLVLDLRNNPGGIVQASIASAALFLQPRQRILTAKGRAGKPEIADVPKGAQPYRFKLAILINEKTASASEIFAGALQDHDRAEIVGEPSYGKGLVQSVLPLSDGAGLAITTAFYYTPSGRSIQRPIPNSALSGIFGADTQAKTIVYKTDSGRTVTGGGGIRPDMEVAEAGHTRLEVVLDASGAITSFATQYLSEHAGKVDNFEVTPAVLDEFHVYLAGRDIQPSVSEWSAESSWVGSRLKEEIVTLARGVAKGDEVQAQRDPQVQAALQAVGGATEVTELQRTASGTLVAACRCERGRDF